MELSRNFSLNASVPFRSANSTDHLPDRSAFLFGRIFIDVTSLSLNSAVVIFHLIKPAYITDFTIYLLFLYCTNIVYLLGAQPLLFWSEMTGHNIGSLGGSVCLVFNYFQRVMSIVPLMCHCLIAFNRLWAIQYPVSYRNRHNYRTAGWIVFGMIGYVHLLNIPPFIIYIPLRYQPITATTGLCQDSFAAQTMQWGRISSALNRFAPLFVIIGIYIQLIVKRTLGRRNAVGSTNNSNAANRTGESVKSTATQKGAPLHKTVVKPFVVLTLTTIGVMICWLPLDAVHFCQTIGVKVPRTYFTVSITLYTFQIMFDPLMWLFSLRFRGNFRFKFGRKL